MKGGQEGIRMGILIWLFYCAENDLLSPFPKYSLLSSTKTKDIYGFVVFCSVVRKIKEIIQVPHLLWYQGREELTELLLESICRVSSIWWRENAGVRGDSGTCRNLVEGRRLFTWQSWSQSSAFQEAPSSSQCLGHTELREVWDWCKNDGSVRWGSAWVYLCSAYTVEMGLERGRTARRGSS